MTEEGRSEPPLCVDLDGTLIEGNTLRISLRHLARTAPWKLLAIPFFLVRGRPALKAWVARQHIPNPSELIWRTEVLQFLKEERGRGRRIVLATAAHKLVADAVCAHLGLFDGIVATESGANLKGRLKTVHIRKCLSCNDFDYIGDSQADIPIFEVARVGYLVAPTASLSAAAKSVGRIAREFHTAPKAK